MSVDGKEPPRNQDQARQAEVAPRPLRVVLTRWTSVAVIVASAVAVLSVIPVGPLFERLDTLMHQAGLLGLLIYLAVFILVTLFCLPVFWLVVMAGAVYGLGYGLLIGMAGYMVADTAVFFLARTLGHGPVRRLTSHWRVARGVSQAIAQGGWRLIALFRISPTMPYGMQGMLIGLSPVRFRTNFGGTLVGQLPEALVYVYLGHLGREGALSVTDAYGSAGLNEWILLLLGLLATVAGAIYVTRLATRALRAEAADAPPPATSPEQNEPRRKRWSPGTASLLLMALGSAAIAVAVRSNIPQVREVVSSALGTEPMARAESTFSGEQTFDPRSLDELLRAVVCAEGLVNYTALAAETDPLATFLAEVAATDPLSLTRDHRLAFLINAYNAFTLQLILEERAQRPLTSIMEIPVEERLDTRRWQIGGQAWSLHQLEHQLIRPIFHEPRIHWALVQGTRGGPPLRAEAYRGESLEAQLADQAWRIHAGPHAERWVRLRQNELHLTRLYDWYAEDFRGTGRSLREYVLEQLPPENRDALGPAPTIEWIDFDWRLNEAELPEADA